MKNIFLNRNTNLWNTVLLLSFFLLTTQFTFAQADPTTFTVTGTNGTCQSNASIKVTIPAGSYNTGWRVYVVKGVFSTDLPLPTVGGDVIFNSLTPGTYTVSLKDTFTTLPAKTITITTSYIGLTVNHSFKVPTCTPTSSGYAPDGELTVRVPTGGIGPFQFDINYPTSATNPAPLSQTFTGSTNAYRTHVFMNIPGGITPAITVTDLANSVAGCGQSITQNPSIPNNTAANVDYGYRAYNFVRTTSCGNPKLYINLSNVTPEREAILSVLGNATITIAGTVYNLTKISGGRWTYDPATTGGPQLVNGLAITTKFNWGCSILQRTTNVKTGDTFTNQNVNTAINANCEPEFRWTIFGDEDSSVGGYTDRNIYFLDVNEIAFEKLVGGVWTPVPNYDITPNPATLGTNPLGVNGAHTLAIPSVGRSFVFKEPGFYRYIAKDACHTTSNTASFTAPIPLNSVTVTKENYGVLQGTSGIRIGLGITLKPNLTIEISRVDGLTSIPITASGPLNLAGSYTAVFPITRVITTPNNTNSYLFGDLPLGEYDVKLSDGCSNIKTVRVNLNNPANYSPAFSTVLGCTGSNKINYNFGGDANAYPLTNPSVSLFRDNGVGGTTGSAIQTINSASGTFINLNSGSYVVVFGNTSPNLVSAAGVTYPKIYTKRITVAPYGGIDLETSAVMCDPANTNSGIINVELVNNTVLSNTTISLFDPSNTATAISGPITLGPTETGTTFTGVPQGTYFVRVSNECTTIERNSTINSGSTGTLPIAKANRSKVCLSDNTVKLAITGSSSLYDVVWTDANDATNTIIGTGTPLPINPTTTKTYKATISLKSSFNCTGVSAFTSNVTVEVTANPDLTSAVVVSDIDLCLNTSRDFTISNSQLGYTYELTDTNEIPFTPAVTATGTGGTLTMAIPNGVTLSAGNQFKIKINNGSAGCTGFLTDVVTITARQNNLNLVVESPLNMICPGTASTLIIKATELGVLYSISKNGSSITSGTGTGSDLSFSILASQLSTGTNEFLIGTSGAGCQNGNLVAKGKILVNKAPLISASTLKPITINGCDNVVVPAAYTSIAELESNGVTITDETADSSLTVSYTDSAITGNAITKYITRTYKITDSCSQFSTVVQYIVLNITTPIAPTITTTTATTFCVGGSVVLTSSATTGNQWFKDGVAITSANSNTYTATGAGTYTVTTTNEFTCTSPVSPGISVVVNTLPIATINNGVTLAFVDCTATTIDLTASNGSAFVWYYSPDNTTPFSVLSATTRTIPATNLGFYKVKVINSTNCEAESQVTQVVAKPAVLPTILEPCVGNTVSLRSNTSSFDTPTFQWKKNGIDIAGATTQNWDVTADGEYTVTVTDGRTIGSIGTQTSCGANVHFNPLPVVDAGTNFTITCTTNPTGLTIGETPETGFDYVWTSSKGISGLTNATIANPVANPTETTTYTVRKTNRTTLCWQEDNITITVDKTAPTANAGSNFTRTCVSNILGKEIGIAPIAGVTYSWYPTTGLDDATKANPIANPETTQTYTLTVENTTNGCTATATVVASVDVSAPTANAGVAFTKTCVTNPTGQLIGAPAVSGETYSWYPTTGLSDATSANPNANPTATTTYTVTARKTATGCVTTATVIVTVLETPNPIALATTIANNCPLETVDLTTIQPAAVSGIVYEWWTGTATTRGAQITNLTTYATAGTIYLWSKSVSEGCYNAVPSAVNVTMNVCCESTIGVIQETNPFYLVNYAPADITTLEHVNYARPSVVRYVIVNDLDGKIKQINTTKPEFTQLPAGNYTVHALVFGPTVVPTGVVVGNKLSQVQPLCGTSASYPILVQSICSSRTTYTEILSNAKQYALVDVVTHQFVQVNTTGTFEMIHNGMPYQVLGFNYLGTATGIQVGGTLAGVSASNLEVTAGAIVSGCTAVITQIDGNVYNDKTKRCIEGSNTQEGLPSVTLYAKLLDSNNRVIEVSSAIQAPGFTFSMSPDLLDGTYSIILDDNQDRTDAVATYPTSWKGSAKTFTVASGQIVEQLSNTANFVPMCMQSATNKPVLRPTANLVGNTYNFCQGITAAAIVVDAIPGAIVNWYTQATGGVANTTPLVPNTTVVGTTFYYVSQTVNGAESDRSEVIIAIQDVPARPTMIAGNNFVVAGSSQNYSVVNSSTAFTYSWILPTDWTGTSTTKDITVQIGTKDALLGVRAISAFGCVSATEELAVRVVIEDDVEVYNSISPNDDGINDVFRIRNIDFYPENTLSIFNRWGIEVYRVNSYGQDDNFFKGFSDGRSTVSRDVQLPEGTYFYTLTYKNTKAIEKNLSGYLYIKQ